MLLDLHISNSNFRKKIKIVKRIQDKIQKYLIKYFIFTKSTYWCTVSQGIRSKWFESVSVVWHGSFAMYH